MRAAMRADSFDNSEEVILSARKATIQKDHFEIFAYSHDSTMRELLTADIVKLRFGAEKIVQSFILSGWQHCDDVPGFDELSFKL